MFVRDCEGIPVVPLYDRLAGDVAADSNGFEGDGDMIREPLRDFPWTLDNMGNPYRIGVEKSEFFCRCGCMQLLFMFFLVLNFTNVKVIH